MSEIIHITSISQLHNLPTIEKPAHPLISVVRHSSKMDFNFGDTRFNSDLYFISLKENIRSAFKYGRNDYDFDEGTMVFMAPNHQLKPGLPTVDSCGQAMNISVILSHFDFPFQSLESLSKKSCAQ